MHPFRVVELVERLIAAGMNEAQRTTEDPDILDRDAEDAVLLDGIKTRALFLRPRLVLRAALEAYYEGGKWKDAGYSPRVFDELERALGGRNLVDTPTSLPEPKLIDVSIVASDIQREYKTSAEEAEAFLIRHGTDIRTAMVKAGYAVIAAAAEAEGLQRS
jgi:hypothetical protein